MSDHEVTPRPAEVAQALLDEIAQGRVTRPPPRDRGAGPASPRSWHWITILFATLLSVGTLVGVLGKAFYVERSEYTTSETANAVAHTRLAETLDRVDRALQAQTQTLAEMSRALNAQAVELASIKRK